MGYLYCVASIIDQENNRVKSVTDHCRKILYVKHTCSPDIFGSDQLDIYFQSFIRPFERL